MRIFGSFGLWILEVQPIAVLLSNSSQQDDVALLHDAGGSFLDDPIFLGPEAHPSQAGNNAQPAVERTGPAIGIFLGNMGLTQISLSPHGDREAGSGAPDC